MEDDVNGWKEIHLLGRWGWRKDDKTLTIHHGNDWDIEINKVNKATRNTQRRGIRVSQTIYGGTLNGCS